MSTCKALQRACLENAPERAACADDGTEVGESSAPFLKTLRGGGGGRGLILAFEEAHRGEGKEPPNKIGAEKCPYHVFGTELCSRNVLSCTESTRDRDESANWNLVCCC